MQPFELRFADLSAGSGSLTWAQREIWESMTSGLARPDGQRTTPAYLCEFPLPGKPPLEQALAALREVLARHESLRTVFPSGANDVLRQDVLGCGKMPVFVAGSGTDDHAAAERLERCLSQPEIGPLTGYPVRAGIATIDDRASRVLLRMSRLATDGWGLDVLGCEIQRRVAVRHHDLDRVVPSQPLEQAEFEASTTAAASTAGALRYWTDVLAAAPRLAWADRMGLRSAATYSRGVITSPAAPAAIRILAARYRATSSAVLLGAFTAVLARLAGTPSYFLRLQASNRVTHAQRAAVCRTKQVALLPVTPPAATIGDLMRDTMLRSLAAYRHARYDPVTLRGPVAILKDGPFFNFNDRRYTSEVGGAPARVDLTDLLSTASLEVETSANHAPNPRIDFMIDAAGNGLPAMRMVAQANLLPAELVGSLLTGLDAFLVAAADAPDDPVVSRVLDRCLS